MIEKSGRISKRMEKITDKKIMTETMPDKAPAETTHIQVNTYPIKDIKAESFFSKPVYLDERFVLTAPEMPFSKALIESLHQWKFKEVFSEGVPVERNILDENSNADVFSDSTVQSDQKKIKQAEEFYTDLEEFVQKLFMTASLGESIDFKVVVEEIKSACEVIKEDRRYLLRVHKSSKKESKNYLVAHSVQSTIISIIIGLYLKLPNHKLLELGVAALLHEIGMFNLPPQIYLSNRTLSLQEKKLILNHPILGYQMLKNFNFPLPFTLGALEHHERENGTGYPRKLTGDKISIYGKIIAVACSYEAISSKRPHKEAKDGYMGMLELLKNEGKPYDDTIVRALVYSLSLYPIGLHVLLSNNWKAQVVDVNPEDPKFPIVQIYDEPTPDGRTKLLQTSPEGIYIIRPLNREEAYKVSET
jgi:HD-GYP domain-containing protein (c-di-GMP phosphodiesterase class II)